MELRKHRKAPRRYSRELEEESSPQTRPSKPSPIKAKIIQYNPDLPPAVFPTLDPRQGLTDEKNLPDNHELTNDQKNARRPTSSSAPERDLTAATAPSRLQQPQTASASQTTKPGMDNGPGNPIWEKNMKLLDELDQRTEEEWFIKECETSSEEESTSNIDRTPVWDDIALALRIQMVYAAIGDDNNANRAMSRLRLNETQQDIMREELRLYEERESAEDAYIASHQKRLNDILLSGRTVPLDEDLFGEFYRDIESMNRDDTVASRAEVNDAKAYLDSCGMDSSALENFQSAGDMPCTDTESDEELERRYPNAPTVREVMAAEAAARGSLPDETGMSQPDPSNTGVSLPSPAENNANGEMLDEESNQVQPTFKRRKITGETIAVDVGDQPSLGSNVIQGMSDSIPRQGNVYGDDYPETPQQITGQGPSFEQTQTAAHRYLGWPATPRTPSLGAVPVLDSSRSDYDANAQSKQTVIPNQKAALTPNFGPASRTRKMAGQLPLFSPKVVGQNGRKGEDQGQAHQGLAVPQGSGYVWAGASTGEAPSSRAPTEQDCPTIVVDVPGEQSTASTRAGGDRAHTMGGTGTTETKTNKRGQSKQSKG
ncbi:MAG: hypothetical protein Q9196_003154 [Gyalolechia fulgens]